MSAAVGPAAAADPQQIADRFKGSDRILYDIISNANLPSFVIDNLGVRATLEGPVHVLQWGITLPAGSSVKMLFCKGYWITLPGHGNLQYRSQVTLRHALMYGPPQHEQQPDNTAASPDVVVLNEEDDVADQARRSRAPSPEEEAETESEYESEDELMEELLEEKRQLNKRVRELETELEGCKRRLAEAQQPRMPAEELQRHFLMFAYESASKFITMSQEGNATCRICMSNKVDRVVTCGHAYCGLCLDRHIASAVRQGNVPPTCPYCRNSGDIRKAKRVLPLYL